MRQRYLKYLQLSLENNHVNSPNFNNFYAGVGAKWLPFFLMAMALILWIGFNILAVESYQFPPYPLLFMNLVMYFLLAAMASPSYSEESKPSSTHIASENRVNK